MGRRAVLAAMAVLVLGLSGEALARSRRVNVDEVIAKEWTAYFEFKNGKKMLVTQVRGVTADLTKQEDYWWWVKYSDYKGPKGRLAVYQFDNKVTGGWRSKVQVDALEEQLVTEVLKTNRWTIVKRKEIEILLKEQDFGASGRVAKPSAAKIGQVLGAQFGVKAAVTEYEPQAAGFGGGAGGAGRSGGGLFGLRRQRAELACNFQIFDTTTSVVTASVQKRGWAAAWGSGAAGGGRSGSGAGGAAAGGFQKTPIGRAVQSCMAKAVYIIVTEHLKDKTWQGKIMLKKGNQLYVNAGENSGMAVGYKLKVLSKGEALVDPDTGLVLGDETTDSGTATVTTVKEKYSIATVATGCDNAKKGDIVEFAGQ